MTTRARLTPTEAELVDAIAEDLEQKHCPECGGVGTVCLFCDQTIDECNCGTDSEPVPCEACNGSGMVALAEGEDVEPAEGGMTMTDTAALATAIAVFEREFPDAEWSISRTGSCSILDRDTFSWIASSYDPDPVRGVRDCAGQLRERSRRLGVAAHHAAAMTAEYGPEVTR